MGLTLGLLFVSLLLLCNSLAILHEQRFLSKVGLGEEEAKIAGGVKLQIANLLKAFRLVLRVPLIFANLITVVALMIGG